MLRLRVTQPRDFSDDFQLQSIKIVPGDFHVSSEQYPLYKHNENRRKNIINYQCNLINYMLSHSLILLTKFNFYVSQMVVAQRNGNLSQFILPPW
jgi:hypothetical protein